MGVFDAFDVFGALTCSAWSTSSPSFRRVRESDGEGASSIEEFDVYDERVLDADAGGWSASATVRVRVEVGVLGGNTKRRAFRRTQK